MKSFSAYSRLYWKLESVCMVIEKTHGADMFMSLSTNKVRGAITLDQTDFKRFRLI